jgi:hypothetical protein
METSKDKSIDMANRLAQAGAQAEGEKKERRERTVKGSHLLDPMMAKIKDFKRSTLVVEEKTGFFKITGPVKGRALYIARKGGRVDLNGFTVTHDAISQISDEEAKDRHLGKVKAQVDFEKGDVYVLDAFDTILEQLVEVPVEAPKPEKAPKVEKAPKAPRVKKAADAPAAAVSTDAPATEEPAKA